MGNHTVGRAMVNTANALKKARPDMPALEILDMACNPYRNTDAEFDDACHPDEEFGKILKEAFAPGVDFLSKEPDADGHWAQEDEWEDQVADPFRARYSLW